MQPSVVQDILLGPRHADVPPAQATARDGIAGRSRALPRRRLLAAAALQLLLVAGAAALLGPQLAASVPRVWLATLLVIAVATATVGARPSLLGPWTRQRLPLVLGLLVLAALGWSAGCVLFFSADMAGRVLYVAMVGAVAAATALLFLGELAIFRAVLLPSLPIVGLALLGDGGGESRLAGASVIFAAGILLLTGHWAGRLHRERRRLEEQNAVMARRLAEQERRLAFAATAGAAADRAWSSFFDMMSHELRTPLNAIIGFSDPVTVAAFAAQPDKLEEHRGLINRSGRQLLAMITDILDLSKIETGRFELRREQLYASDLANACLTIVAELAMQRGVAIEVEIADPAPVIWADERATRQMLVNLLSNACKFTERGGGVVTLRFEPAPGGAVIRVADTGIGMDARAIAAATGGIEALARYDAAVDAIQIRQQRRAGFGLPLVAALINLHEGKLTIDSAPGRGTTVSLFFPLPGTAKATRS